MPSALSSNQELQKAMDSHKSEVLSINLSSADFLQSEPDSEEAWELRDRLKEMNSHWERLSNSLEDWREELQRALMQCQVKSRLSFLHLGYSFRTVNGKCELKYLPSVVPIKIALLK